MKHEANEGQLTEDGGGYCFFWSGRTSEEWRDAGVGFVIRPHLVINFASLPIGLNFRTAHELVITNTLFRLSTRNKTTWMDASPLKALASDWLHYHKEERCKWRQSDEVNVWGRVLDWPQTIGVQAHTTHPKQLIKRLNVTQLSYKSVNEDLTLELDCKLAEVQLDEPPLRKTG